MLILAILGIAVSIIIPTYYGYKRTDAPEIKYRQLVCFVPFNTKVLVTHTGVDRGKAYRVILPSGAEIIALVGEIQRECVE